MNTMENDLILKSIEVFEENENKEFLFGYEESYGYYKSQGMTLYDGLLGLYEKYGYYR
ncbi:MAG: hypothetical protein N4A64_02610 [Marinisporobacter sp.]|jgi:phosphoglucomutase|nr:hypothetical protein [Marinisporobacter sp.]